MSHHYQKVRCPKCQVGFERRPQVVTECSAMFRCPRGHGFARRLARKGTITMAKETDEEIAYRLLIEATRRRPAADRNYQRRYTKAVAVKHGEALSRLED